MQYTVKDYFRKKALDVHHMVSPIPNTKLLDKGDEKKYSSWLILFSTILMWKSELGKPYGEQYKLCTWYCIFLPLGRLGEE